MIKEREAPPPIFGRGRFFVRVQTRSLGVVLLTQPAPSCLRYLFDINPFSHVLDPARALLHAELGDGVALRDISDPVFRRLLPPGGCLNTRDALNSGGDHDLETGHARGVKVARVERENCVDAAGDRAGDDHRVVNLATGDTVLGRSLQQPNGLGDDEPSRSIEGCSHATEITISAGGRQFAEISGALTPDRDGVG